MEENKDKNKHVEDRTSDNKSTAGDLPEKEEQFENTSWSTKADHGESATEAERKNVSKTLPPTAKSENERND